MRFLPLLLLMFLGFGAVSANAAPVESFAAFLAGFEAKAVRHGISPETYRAATAGLTQRANIPGLISTQPEFTTPIWDYMEKRVSSGRIARGWAAMARHAKLFARIGQEYGVDPAILGAIWGMETDFGAVLGNKALIKPIIRSLATLAHYRRDRVEADELEFIAALQLIENGGWRADTLVGSWAGAIGHTQIIASGIMAHGTDGDGDNIVNPHASLADALATTAVFMRALGYTPGFDWGFEVEVPEGFDFSIATPNEMKRLGFFATRGVKRVKGRQFKDLDLPVFMFLPGGRTGPKFLLTANYAAIKGYNFSDSYAFSVAHLTDRLKGAEPLVGTWPRNIIFPNLQQRVDIQRWLKQLGYYRGAVDGRIGPITNAAYQQFQRGAGIVADGFVTLNAHKLLKAVVQ